MCSAAGFLSFVSKDAVYYFVLNQNKFPYYQTMDLILSICQGSFKQGFMLSFPIFLSFDLRLLIS